MALTKVSGGILDPGISVAGIVTATGFDGPFIGGSSKNIVAGIITATELDISGDIDVDGHTELDQLNVSGVSTFVGNIGGNPTFSGDVTFNGNVSIAQTLTYSDVTNIDSVGIVTAREGVRVPYDGTNSTKYISVGASDDLKIYHHASSFSFIENNTGILHLRSVDGIKLQDQNGSEMFINCVDNGAVELYHDNLKKLETNSSGIKVAGDIRVGNGSGLSIKDDSASETLATFNNNGSVQLYHNNVNKFQTTSTGAQLPISSGGDGLVFYNSGDVYPEIVGNVNRTLGDKFLLSLAGKWNNNHSVAKIVIKTGNDTTNKDDGRISFFTAQTGGTLLERLEVTPLGHVNIYGDSKKLQIGGGQDLQLYHDGTNSRIHNTATGSLILRNEVQDADVSIQGNDGGSNITMLAFDASEAGNATFTGNIKLN